MLKTQKKMHELQAELKDLGVDEEKARFDSFFFWSFTDNQ